MDNSDKEGEVDICRVCRTEGSFDKPLFHPCMCTGSIKFIHQDCLVQWLKHSKKEYCELCKHRFVFKPIYAPDMPSTLPFMELFRGLGKNILKALRYWLHYLMVAIAWLGVVPLTAYRIYKCLFAGSVSSLLTLPLDILSTENVVSDCVKGCFVVGCSVCAFIVLVWLREQITVHGGPDWLEAQDEPLPQLNLPGVARGLFGGGGGGNEAAAANQANVEQQQEQGENDQGGEEQNEEQNNQPAAAVDDWNPDWERAAEDLTWERFLGLDGSLVFLEHVFWIISLNTSFILVFAFCPFHIGHFALVSMSVDRKLTGTEFDGLITSVLGYFILAVGLIVFHRIAGFGHFKRVKRILGLCYVVIKVALIMVVEIGIFPLVQGWWLDICALPLFAVALKDRKASFLYAPGTATFLHWLVGMLYVFYFASFVILLREILRPGVLWFLRNLNDPDFHPMQEMIHLPVVRHVRRFALSLIVFGTSILIMVWIPVQVIKRLLPKFLPYNIVLTSDAPVSELSLELLLLQVVLPALLEQAHTRQWLKNLVRLWVVSVAYILNLRSYLLGDVSLDGIDERNIVQYGNNPVPDVRPENPPAANPGVNVNNPPPPPPGNFDLHGDPNPPAVGLGFQPYIRPNYFALKVFCLVGIMSVSLTISSFLMMTVPVSVGRYALGLVLGGAPIHELYTAAAGLYILWLACRIGIVLYSWIPLGSLEVVKKLAHWAFIALKLIGLALIFVGIVPLLLGLIFELVVVLPLRVPLDQTPLIFLWQDWALGVLHTKILCAVIMIGPNWWLKRVLEQVYQDGIQNIRIGFIMLKLAWPVIAALLLMITVPYVFAGGVIPIFGVTLEVQVFILRRIYPFLLIVLLMTAAMIFQGRQFQYLYEKIKNDKYLIGQRLVNYQHSRIHESQTTTNQHIDDSNQPENQIE